MKIDPRTSRVQVQAVNSISLKEHQMIQACKKKGQQGFTLVEVIVVAIIVAALAAVAIPLYNGYVTSSRNNAAANAAGSVASFMGTCVNQGGTAAAAPVFAAGAAIAGPQTITCTIAGVTPSPSIAVPACSYA